jgi:PAS domain S-box-containing protein
VLTVKGANIGVWEVDMPDGVFENGRWEVINYWEQLGYDRPEGPTDYETVMDLIHPEDRAGMRRAVEAHLSGAEQDYEAEYRVRHRNGTYRWVLARGAAVRDSSGKPILFTGCRTDITDLKQAEEAQREGERRFRTIVETANEGIWMIDQEGRTRYMNARMAEILLLPPEAI